ncbi:MAG: hypothetical protein KKD01_05335 [Proteobacteria bacterium]|nr:hypothetical protein [Pseudomonadota bacterium]MBU1233971.1 hypothetical protein [Pseudomonadota bacterium]MBU1419676.1 hypothetical protein [Pseudomonadota bacterium]MBU1454132.1 hypothetical protein [Pseudomonadota bacterium]
MIQEKRVSRYFFDENDYVLLNIVNDVLNRDEAHKLIKNLLIPYLHPHGIKEMTASMALRIAYAVIHLLGSLEAGKAADRQNALRCLRDEVLCSSQSMLRRNTARVLLEIMKELVRSKGDYLRQLKLARDFRTATFGKPRFIRSQLKKYHLIEMPEEWNQIAFDDHVHDANSKGRKSPTHLIMDAWIKGIRRLTVIYYNFINVEVAAELLESAEVMGITVRIGIEFSARFRGRYVKFIWAPRGFADSQDFLNFIKDGPAKTFMDEGRKVSQYQQCYVVDVFREFNSRHRPVINEAYGINLPVFDREEFLTFVGSGQPSLLHLAKFIYNHMLSAMREQVLMFRNKWAEADEEERLYISHAVEIMNALDPDAIIESFLQPDKNPDISNPFVPHDDSDVPGMLLLSPEELLTRLESLRTGSRVTLNLSELSPADVLELINDCKGKISHLEIFNLKDYTRGKAIHYAEINKLQLAINQGNIINLKRVIQKIIRDLSETDPLSQEMKERREKLTVILHNMLTLHGFYKRSKLKSRIGSDSTGGSRNRYGMGLVMKDTLPRCARRELESKRQPSRWNIPVRITAHLQVTYIPRRHHNGTGDHRNVPWDHKNLGSTPSCALEPVFSGLNFGFERQRDWVVQAYSTHMEPNGNVATLGWMQTGQNNALSLDTRDDVSEQSKIPLGYLNHYLKNGLRILIGFIPAFATFALTKDWWFLAYFGAFIWFGITGIRNIIQSVLGAGGFSRSPLLKWKEYVSWDRLSYSLLFTGFSVPLLDLLVKTLILERMFGITTGTNPVALYSFMALANGVYISGHNIFRGLPKGAVYGNFFRSILSIPLAILFNGVVGWMLGGASVVAVNDILQKWAAVISKLASDCVAGFIEGLADRFNNIRFRSMDYSAKIAQVFETYAALEVFFPEEDVLEMLESPKEFMRAMAKKNPDLGKIVIINALDLLYIWMYQPRATSTLPAIMKAMSPEERRIMVASQLVLMQQRQISQLFVDGVLGKKFSRALSFYLDRSEEYLKSFQELSLRVGGQK